jgi:4-hydroxy 2-oxovalerate aldolase
VLLLGSGPGAARHRAALEKYIIRHKPVVLALNTQATVDQALIDIRLASHPVRLMADYRVHATLAQPLITPVKMLPPQILQALRDKKLLNFGMSVQNGTFDALERHCVIPTSLVAAYALAVATSGDATRITVAGFDGYEPGDLRNEEMRALLELYLSDESRPPIVSITPTVFNVLESHSVYGMIR